VNLRTTDFAFMEQAAQQDADDALGHYREQFNLPEGLIYLDGNSLGPLPKSVPPAMHRLLNDEWGDQLIGDGTSPTGLDYLNGWARESPTFSVPSHTRSLPAIRSRLISLS